MSKPTKEQAKDLTDRVCMMVSEWDDCNFCVFIEQDNDNYCIGSSASPFQKTIMAKLLLDDAIEVTVNEE